MNRLTRSLNRRFATLGFMIVAACAMVLLADRLFYRHVVGWSAGIFVAGMVLLLILRPARRATAHVSRAAALVCAGLAVALCIEPTPLCITVTCIAIGSFAIISRQGGADRAGQWIMRWIRLIMIGWLAPLLDAAVAARWIVRHPAAGLGGPAAGMRGAFRWTVPLLLGGGFLLLFSLANPIVQDWLTRTALWAWGNIARIDRFLIPDRIALWLITGAVVWALMRVRRVARRGRWSVPSTGAYSATSRTIIPIDRHGLVERCLIVFNLLFAMESGLDIVYLWGGRQLPAGMTFKEYAHRGAYPLIATAVLAAAFVLVAFGKHAASPSWERARKLVYLWIVQNILLTFSAGWRLVLLVNASNLTRWRLATAIWLVLIALGLQSIIWRIWARRDHRVLVNFNAAAAMLAIYTCCFLNLDGFIANYNADHCLDIARRGDVLGLTYLHDLGIESIPALDRLSTTLDTPERRAMARRFADELRTEVASDLDNWRGWTWRRWSVRPGPQFHPPPFAPAAATRSAYVSRTTPWTGERR